MDIAVILEEQGEIFPLLFLQMDQSALQPLKLHRF